MALPKKEERSAAADKSSDVTLKSGRPTVANAALMIYVERPRHGGLSDEVKKRSAS